LNIKIESDDELKQLAIKVLANYDIVPQEISVIQGGSIKAVWKLRYNNKIYCLKRLKQTLDKVIFSVNAQLYIKKAGGNVPDVYLAKDGESIVQFNGQLFVLYEWLTGSNLNFSTPNDLSNAIKGLAKFHLYSKGYVAKEGARISSKLGKCPSQYESMMRKMIAWKEIAKAKGTSQHQTYLKYVDEIVNIADKAIILLKNSRYQDLISVESTSPVLCHQDYGKGNALQTENGVVVIDLDGVTFDLPSRDLRKLIGKMAENNGKWDETRIADVISWYSSVNKLSEDEKKILYIDLLFPHWFFGLVKNQYDIMKDLKSVEIEKIAKLEISKLAIINKLIER